MTRPGTRRHTARTASAPSDRLAAAKAALDEVGRDPQQAWELAQGVLEVAGRQADAAATAHRAAALALRELGDLGKAETHAHAAVRCADRTSESALQAETRMTLAFVLLERGRTRAARHQADEATALATGVLAARVQAQRALILQRVGRLDAAIGGYAAALPVLRRHGDRLWEARLLNNRGLLRFERGNTVAAAADLRAARDLLVAQDLPMLAADAEWNLALVAARRGDIPEALASFDRAAAVYTRLATPGHDLLLDRGTVLLSAGLYDEARQVVEQAVANLTESGKDLDLGHARLALAQVNATSGRHADALRDARAAATLFSRQGRPGWARLAGLIALHAEDDAGAAPARVLAEALQTAADMQRSGWLVAEVDARLVASRAATMLGRLEVSQAQLALSARQWRRSSLESRIRGQYARALLNEAEGDFAAANAAVNRGMRLLSEHQSLLGATELRVHASAIGVELMAKGQQLAIDRGDARRVWQWADRWRARATRPRPVRPPRDPALTEALSQVRRVHAATQQAQLDGGVLPTVSARRAAERAVVVAARKAGAVGQPLGPGSGADPTPAELVGALGASRLIEFVEHDGELLAVTVNPGAAGFRLHRLGPVSDVADTVAQLHFLLRRLATQFGSQQAAARTRVTAMAVAAQLETQLLGPLGITPGAVDEIVIVPSAALHGVPWSVLPVLIGLPFLIAPSAAAWWHAARTVPRNDGHRVLVGGPGLVHADAEVQRLRTRPDDRVFRHPHSTVEEVLAAMDGAAMAHLAVHGQLRTDNPLFSALVLDDGPLTIYDIESLGTAPDLVVLSSCESGVSATRAGDELIGLVSALLAVGTRTVVASVIRTPDGPTATLMVAFHRLLADARSPAHALAQARLGADRSDPAMFAAAAGFSCFGA